MYKKILLFFLFFSVFSVFMPNKVEAHSCPNNYYTYRTLTTKYSVKYYAPSGPTQTSGTVTDRDLTASDFTSSQRHDYRYEQQRALISYTHLVIPAVKDGDGNVIRAEEHTCTPSTGSYAFYSWVNGTEYLTPTITVSYASGSKNQGYKEFLVTSSGNGLSSSNYFRSYFVNKIVVTVSAAKTYEDQAYPTVSCTKWYGYGVGYGSSVNCYDSVILSDDNSSSIRNLTYSYSENGNTDSATTQRVYVEKVAISGPDTVYTGQRHTFNCVATFYDGKTKYVHDGEYVMSSAPYSYIGTTWLKTGWKNPDGSTHKPTTANQFYSVDNESRTYDVKCTYYPDRYGNYVGYKANDNNKYEKSTTKSVNHIGIKQIDIDSSGYFPSGPDNYRYISKVNKSQQRGGVVTGVKYITGHWYDFKAMLTYDDGTTRDITTVPEVYWTSSPWYEGSTPYNKPEVYYSSMTDSGLSHRIPVDGTNTIAVEYFNRNVPYGGNSSSGYANNYLSRNWLNLEAKQIAKVEIKGSEGYTTPPKTSVNVNEEVRYSAWITWSDGSKEDWTTALIWGGDYSFESDGGSVEGWLGLDVYNKGRYFFSFPGKQNKTTVSAYYGDIVDTYKTNKEIEDWDSIYDQIEVTINYDCADVKLLVDGCPIPKDNWQTEPYKFFENITDTKNENFLPPPSAFGYELNSWVDANGEWHDSYPYFFDFKFNVSGISQGNGRQ